MESVMLSVILNGDSHGVSDIKWRV